MKIVKKVFFNFIFLTVVLTYSENEEKVTYSN